MFCGYYFQRRMLKNVTLLANQVNVTFSVLILLDGRKLNLVNSRWAQTSCSVLLLFRKSSKGWGLTSRAGSGRTARPMLASVEMPVLASLWVLLILATWPLQTSRSFHFSANFHVLLLFCFATCRWVCKRLPGLWAHKVRYAPQLLIPYCPMEAEGALVRLLPRIPDKQTARALTMEPSECVLPWRSAWREVDHLLYLPG